MQRFGTRSVLVVGGSGGIGAHVSRELARRGCDVYVHGGSDAPALERTLAACAEHGVRAEGELLLIESGEAVRPLVHRAEEALGAPLGAVIVALGPYVVAPLLETTAEQWRMLTELNLVVPQVLVQTVLPGVVARRYGRIVLFGGPRADRVDGYRLIGAYATAKAGVLALARSVARQHAGDGVQANVVSPGFVETEYLSEQERARGKRRSPAGRLVDPAEVAAEAAYLVVDAGDAVNGTVICVDDGL